MLFVGSLVDKWYAVQVPGTAAPISPVSRPPRGCPELKYWEDRLVFGHSREIK